MSTPQPDREIAELAEDTASIGDELRQLAGRLGRRSLAPDGYTTDGIDQLGRALQALGLREAERAGATAIVAKILGRPVSRDVPND